MKLDSLVDTSIKENILHSCDSSIAIVEELSKVDLPADLSSIEADVVSYLASSKLQNSSSHLACSPLSTSASNGGCDEIPRCSLFDNSIISTYSGETPATITNNKPAGENSSYNSKVSTFSETRLEPDQITTVLSNFPSTSSNSLSKDCEVKHEMQPEKVLNSNQSIFDNFESFLSDDDDEEEILCPEVIEKLMGTKKKYDTSHSDLNEHHFIKSNESEYNKSSTPIIVSQTPESVTISIPDHLNEPISDVSALRPELQHLGITSDIQNLLNDTIQTSKETLVNDLLPLILEKSSIASISQDDFKAITNDASLPLDKISEMTKKTSKKVVVKKHQCPVCAKLFRKPCDVKRHLRTHTGEKPFKCELCDKTFSVRSTQRVHQKSHMENRLIQCDVCSDTFSTIALLKSHKKSHEFSLYPCLFCPHKFVNSHHWKRHVNIHHSDEISVKDVQKGNDISEEITNSVPLNISSNVSELPFHETTAIAEPHGLAIGTSTSVLQKKFDINNKKFPIGLIANEDKKNIVKNLNKNTCSKSGNNKKRRVISKEISSKEVSDMINANVVQRREIETSDNLALLTKSFPQKTIVKRTTSNVKKCDLLESEICKRSGDATDIQNKTKLVKTDQVKSLSMSSTKIKFSNCHENPSEMPISQKFCYNESHSLSNLYQSIVGESIEEDIAKSKSSAVGSLKARVTSGKSIKLGKPYEKTSVLQKSTVADTTPAALSRTYDSKKTILSSIPQITLENSDSVPSLLNEYECNFDNQSEITVNTDGSFSLEETIPLNASTNLHNSKNSLGVFKCSEEEILDTSKLLDKSSSAKCGVKFDFKLKNSLGGKLKLIEAISDNKNKLKEKIECKIDEATKQLRERGIDIEPVFEQNTLPDNITWNNNPRNSQNNSLVVQVSVNEVGKHLMLSSLQTNKVNKLKEDEVEKIRSSTQIEPLLAPVTTSICKIDEFKVNNNESKVKQIDRIYKQQNDELYSILNCVKSDLSAEFQQNSNYEEENILPLRFITRPHKRQLMKSISKKIATEENSTSCAIDKGLLAEEHVGETCMQLSNNADKVCKERSVSLLTSGAQVKHHSSSEYSDEEERCFHKASQVKSNVDDKYFLKKIKLEILQSNKKVIPMDQRKITPISKVLHDNEVSVITIQNSDIHVDKFSVDNKFSKTDSASPELKVPVVKAEEDSIVISWVD